MDFHSAPLGPVKLDANSWPRDSLGALLSGARTFFGSTGALFVLACFVGGCSTTHYRTSADKEVYGLISEKSPDVPGMTEQFSVDAEEVSELEDLPVNAVFAEFLGADAEYEVGTPILSLEKALETAFKHSREYQNRKERLYLRALGLTLSRYRFSPIFSGSVSGDYAATTRDELQTTELGRFLQVSPQVSQNIAQLTGSPATFLNQYAGIVAAAASATGADLTRVNVVDEKSVSGRSRGGVDVLMKGGARLALSLTSDILRFLTGDQRDAASSVLQGSLTQPLLRGRGRAVAAESLTQAERDLLYELRDFTRFRKTFSVRVASAYYGVLQNRDAVKNTYLAMNSFALNLERERALADEGLSTPAQVGRFEQSRFSSESRWINSINRYKRSLDSLKIMLGFSTDRSLVLDDDELVKLGQRGLIHPDLSSADAVAVALVTRLDLYNGRDRTADADRRVVVAANALKPGLDLVLSGSVDSKDGNRLGSPDFQRARWSAGLDVDLPFDRRAERNAYRAALIDYERSIRDRDLLEDGIKLEVRDAWRSLDQTQRNYAISLQTVELNVRRVEEQDLRAELGLGNVLDQVDAQNDLTDSMNDLTGQLVSHTIARLVFWQDIGILFIKENGQWEEVGDVAKS